MSELTHLVTIWRAKADDLLRISKSYKCRSHESTRMAYIKQAAQLRMCADELEASMAEAARNPTTPQRQTRTGQSRSHQAARPVDVPSMPEGDDTTGSGSPDPDEPGRIG
jgi:hypothetical protein